MPRISHIANATITTILKIEVNETSIFILMPHFLNSNL
jgi:hypothetical protein